MTECAIIVELQSVAKTTQPRQPFFNGFFVASFGVASFGRGEAVKTADAHSGPIHRREAGVN